MKRRFLESLGVAAVIAAVVLFLHQSAAGQAPAAKPAAEGSAVPKTAWGHPDLQGIWLDEFDTPLERPARFANKEFLTEEERTAQDNERSGNIGRNERAEVGSRQDVPVPTTRYSPRRSRLAGGRRSSSIRRTAEFPR